MVSNFNLTRVNRIAGLAIIPMMVLAIVVFGRFTDGDASSSEPPPTAGLLVVANLRSETLAFIDLSSNSTRTLQLPGPPHEMVEAGGRLYVTLGRGNAVAEVEPASASIVRLLAMEGEPHGLAVYGDNLVVTLDKGNAAVVLDRVSFTELRRFSTGDTPHSVAVSNAAIVVTDSRDHALHQIEPEQVVTVSGEQPEAVTIVAEYAVSADAHSGSLTFARLPGLTAAIRVQVGAGPVRVVASGAESVLVALQEDDEVVQVRVPSGEISRRLDVAGRPDGICIAPDGEYVAVASNGEGAVEVFSTKDWKVAARLSLDPGLGSCLWQTAR